MTPAELLDDHQRRPRNIGKLMNATATGDVGSIVVGDALRFYLAIEGERITAAKFQVFNCQDQLATASSLTELVVGRSVDEALTLGPIDLCAHLGGLDPALLPPRPWAFDAMRAAALSWRGEDPPCDAEIDPLLCRCHAISEETVRQSIKVMDLQDTDAVVAATGAGTGCGSCRADIPRLLREVREAPAPAPASPKTSAAKGRIPTMHKIDALVRNEVNPPLAGRGALDLVDFDGRLVTVRVSGALAGDQDALRQELERFEVKLKTVIDPAIGVRLRP